MDSTWISPAFADWPRNPITNIVGFRETDLEPLYQVELDRLEGAYMEKIACIAPFDRISDWLRAGNLDSGYQVVSNSVEETGRSIGFPGKRKRPSSKFGEYAVVFIKRTMLKSVIDDFYQPKAKDSYLVPVWYIRSLEHDEDLYLPPNA